MEDKIIHCLILKHNFNSSWTPSFLEIFFFGGKPWGTSYQLNETVLNTDSSYGYRDSTHPWLHRIVAAIPLGPRLIRPFGALALPRPLLATVTRTTEGFINCSDVIGMSRGPLEEFPCC